MGEIFRKLDCRRLTGIAAFSFCAVISFGSQTVQFDTASKVMLARPKASNSCSLILGLNRHFDLRVKRQLGHMGVKVRAEFPFIQSVSVELPETALRKLKNLDFVSTVSFDGKVTKNDEFTVRASKASVAWASPYSLSGSNVNVAVVDSGVMDTDDLRTGSTKRVIKAVSFGNLNTNDTCGHGTHVAGIIAGNGFQSSGSNFFRTFYGIAPKAGIVAVKVLDSQGSGTVSTALQGINWVIANKGTYKIKVMNLSLGHPVGESYTTDPLCKAVEAAWKAGIVVVCAAGNNGRLNAANTAGAPNEGWGTAYGSIQSPANDPYVITVGATKSIDLNRANDRIATYSSRGPTRLDLVVKPDILAAGNRVISIEDKGAYLAARYVSTNEVLVSYYSNKNVSQISPYYFYLSGTSMASPVVAGAAALMLQANSALTPDTIKARLMLSATKMVDASGLADVVTYGAGYLDIPAALSSNAVASQSALSPTLKKDSFGNVYFDTSGLYTTSLWGTGVTDLRAVWGSRALWGASQTYVDGSRAMWGSSVWADRAMWGTSTSAVDLTSVTISGE